MKSLIAYFVVCFAVAACGEEDSKATTADASLARCRFDRDCTYGNRQDKSIKACQARVEREWKEQAKAMEEMEEQYRGGYSNEETWRCVADSDTDLCLARSDCV